MGLITLYEWVIWNFVLNPGWDIILMMHIKQLLLSGYIPFLLVSASFIIATMIGMLVYAWYKTQSEYVFSSEHAKEEKADLGKLYIILYQNGHNHPYPRKPNPKNFPEYTRFFVTSHKTTMKRFLHWYEWAHERTAEIQEIIYT